MKLHYLLLLLLVQFSQAQMTDDDKANKLSIEAKYPEEIKLRQSMLQRNADENSEAFKLQNYKLKLAEFNNSTDADYRLKKIAEAESIFNSLKSPDPTLKIDLGVKYYSCLMVLGKHDEAKAKIIATHELVRQLPPSLKREEQEAEQLVFLSAVSLNLAAYDESIMYQKQALSKYIEIFGENSLETAAVYKDLARIYSFTDDFGSSLSNLEKALEIYERIQPDDKFILFDIYASLYERYKLYGDLEKVEFFFQKINSFYEINKKNDSFINRKSEDYPNLNAIQTIFLYIQVQHAAILHAPERLEKAFADFINTLPKGKVNYNNRELNTIVSYHFETGYFFHKSDDYKNMGNYKKAQEYYGKALKFTQKEGFEFGELQAYWILSTLGVDYKQWSDVIEATELAFKKPAVQKFNQLRALKHNLALAYGGMQHYDKAIGLLDEEYLENLNGNATDYFAIDNIRESGDLYLEMYSHDPQPQFLEKAYNNFHLCSVIFSRLYRGGEFSVRLSWYQDRINEGLLRTASLMGKNQKMAAERVEVNNSDYLWSSFIKNRKEPFNENAVKMQAQIDSLEMRQRVLAREIKSDTIKEEQLARFRSDLKTAEKSFRSLNKQLLEDDGSFYQFSRTDFDLGNLQKELKKNEVLVKYVISHASVFAFTIQKKGVTVKELSLSPTQLKEGVSEYLTALKKINPGFEVLSKELYKNLILPLEISKNKHLIIIPQSYLAHLPFETLINPNGEYLIENHPVSYGYSLKLLDIQKSIKDKSKGMLAAFSPDYSPNFASISTNPEIAGLVRSGNYELLGAKEEAKQVSSLFKGDLFNGPTASKTNFKNTSGNYDILHLAMHAIIDEDDANHSNLIFDNDERLYLSELYEMKIPAHLAVLSACDTGFGEIKKGEGVQSLSRAFTYAGVKSTVMSLWSVPDRETSVIMVDFYSHLKAGKSKNEALQLAKVNYLKNVTQLELKHPYYWAGFIVNGDVSALETGWSFWWYVGLAAFILLLLFFYLKNKRYL